MHTVHLTHTPLRASTTCTVFASCCTVQSGLFSTFYVTTVACVHIIYKSKFVLISLPETAVHYFVNKVKGFTLPTLLMKMWLFLLLLLLLSSLLLLLLLLLLLVFVCIQDLSAHLSIDFYIENVF